MSGIESQRLRVLPRLVLVCLLVLVVAGVAWNGIALATIERVCRQLIERPGGPMTFRFILQPAMAAIAAIKDGRKDAQLGRSPYFWTMLRQRGERIGRLNDGLNATARIILLGLVMDAVYQLYVLDRFYPVEAVIIALVLAFVPYVILRGIVLRIALRLRRDPAAPRGR
jgi:hypothetical protein